MHKQMATVAKLNSMHILHWLRLRYPVEFIIVDYVLAGSGDNSNV